MGVFRMLLEELLCSRLERIVTKNGIVFECRTGSIFKEDIVHPLNKVRREKKTDLNEEKVDTTDTFVLYFFQFPIYKQCNILDRLYENIINIKIPVTVEAGSLMLK